MNIHYCTCGIHSKLDAHMIKVVPSPFDHKMPLRKSIFKKK